jgi:hypothetical protein
MATQVELTGNTLEVTASATIPTQQFGNAVISVRLMLTEIPREEAAINKAIVRATGLVRGNLIDAVLLMDTTNSGVSAWLKANDALPTQSS